MKLILKKSKKTYTNSKGLEKNYYNLYLEMDNGKRFQIKPKFDSDLVALKAFATYEK